LYNEEPFPAICHIQNTPTEPSRLQETPSHPLEASQVLVSWTPLNLHLGAVDIVVISDDNSWTRVTMGDCSWFRCLWSQIMHVVAKWSMVAKLHHVLQVEVSAWFR